MIFPFKITKKYKLDDSNFGDYSTDEIMNRVYNNLTPLGFKYIKKENNKIELKGDKRKWYLYFTKPDLTSHCIDKGTIEAIELNKIRTIKYTYQILHWPIYILIITILIPFIFGLIFNSLVVGLTFFKILIVVNILMWIFLILINPSMIGSTLEKYRYDTIRNRNKK